MCCLYVVIKYCYSEYHSMYFCVYSHPGLSAQRGCSPSTWQTTRWFSSRRYRHPTLERERKRCRREKKAAIDRGKQLGRNEITASRRAKKTAKALRNTAGAARRDRTCQRKAQGSGTGPSAQRAGRKATRAAQQQDQPPPPPPQHRRYSRQQGQQQWRVPQHQQGNQQHPSQQQWRAQPPPPPRQPSHHTPPWPRRA